jgi:type VI secretion system secreted protein VgrG
MPLLGRDTSVTGPFPKGVLLLETLMGQEVLGRPYKFHLSLLSKEPSIEPDDMLGKPLAVGIQLVTGEERFFHGIVTDIAKVGTTHLHTRYAAELRSMLSLFDHTLDCRIFNDPSQNALSIITAVLAQRGLTDVESGAIQDHAYRKRDYCVQYRESDLRFVQRLLEEEGIYYFFKHEEAKHTLVFADSITGHETVTGYESILYTPEDQGIAGSEEHFWSMKVRRSLYPGRHTVLSGYDPTALRPKHQQFGRATSEDLVTAYPFEHYDYPDGLLDPEEAQQEADLRARAGCVDHATIEVDGNTVGLGLGHLVSLRPGPDSGETFPFWREEDFGKQYFVVGATYSLSIDQLETGDVAGSDEPFKARYQLLDSHTQFRPNRVTPKPRMRGPQTALAGEEIWTDKFGRVMVQFDWDRLGIRNEKSSCWVRMAQAWAGARWGAQYLPRVGQEVIVAFIDGDPDRPIIRGHLYSKDNMPPYELPANQTQSGIKSRSTKGGTASNFNELRFEDKKGHEELHFQAEEDMSTLVKHNQVLRVGTDRFIIVGNDETNLVKNDRALTVDKNDSVAIGGTHDKTITGPVTQIYGGDHSRKVDGQQEFFAEKNKDQHVKLAYKLTTDKKFQLNQAATSMTFKGSNVTMDSAGTITLQAGGATVCLDKTGKATFDSPTGIKFVVGGSSLAILPGGVVLASPAVTAAAGAGSVVAMGADAVAMKSKTVTIEADGVCSIKGKSALKLQEAEPVKAKKSKGPSPPVGERPGAPGAGAKPRKRPQKGTQPESAALEIHVVDLDQTPQEGLAFKIAMPDGATASGNLDKEGRGLAKSSSPGIFKVTFPDLDGGDWDGDGALEVPEEKRSEASRVKATSEDRVPALARKHGFINWRTVWDFAGNAGLKALRENPNVLWEGDEVAIPSKVERHAEVTGGSAEFMVNREDEKLVRIRPLDFELQPFDGIRYQGKRDNTDINKGVIPPSGFIVLQVPIDARKGVLSLFLSNAADAKPLNWNFDIQDEVLANSTEDEAQRLINLGFATTLPKGDEKNDDYRLALAAYRECVGKPLDDDAALAEKMVAMHDGGGAADPDDGTGVA